MQQSSDPMSLDQTVQSILINNFGLKPTESFLLVTDPQTQSVAQIWLDVAKNLASKTTLSLVENMTDNAQEPLPLIANQMSHHDVAILHTQFSLSHTHARFRASRTGTRSASLPGVTQEIVERTLNADYLAIKDRSIVLANRLTLKSTVHITTKAGTDITLSIKGRDGLADTGIFINPGDFGNLPAGEAFIAPLEEETNGTIVFDGTFGNDRYVEPMRLEIEKGMVTRIVGGESASKLRDSLAKLHPHAGMVGELGIGTNPTANPRGKLIEAEKALGTIHIALGNNSTFGGTINVPFHSDGVVLNPTVTIDDHLLLENGQLSFDKQHTEP